ncbi:putative RNA binding protein YcfA (HicA-like mRNA interferase family) [Pseudomonas silensiensis]|nr:putative RNA binding protein YcfA (HicA-like mRNA interferase family) [Pseudomonas silensiensis]
MKSITKGVVVPQSKNTVSPGWINPAASLPMRRFFFDVAGVLFGHAVIAGLVAIVDSGDVATEQAQVVGVFAEVAAQGHLGHVQQCRHLAQMNGALVLQGLLNQLETLGFFTVHRHSGVDC